MRCDGCGAAFEVDAVRVLEPGRCELLNATGGLVGRMRSGKQQARAWCVACQEPRAEASESDREREGLVAAAAAVKAMPKFRAVTISATCTKCGGAMTAGPFLRKCLSCEPHYAEPCRICGTSRVSCCC